MNFKEKLMKYAAMQKEAIELLTKNEKESAIAKMSEAAEAFDEIVTEAPEEVATPQSPETTPADPAKEEGESFTGEEIQKLKKYASLYADGDSIADILKDIADAKDMITTLTKKVEDQATKIETLEKAKGVSQQSDGEHINKKSDERRSSIKLG